jgi:hypothetical protein
LVTWAVAVVAHVPETEGHSFALAGVQPAASGANPAVPPPEINVVDVPAVSIPEGVPIPPPSLLTTVPAGLVFDVVVPLVTGGMVLGTCWFLSTMTPFEE